MATVISHLFSLARTGRILAKHDALIPADILADAPVSFRVLRRMAAIGAAKGDPDLRPGQKLVPALEELGPGFIKMGQLLATRPDFVGPEVANDLSALQDSLPPFDQAEAEKAVEEELGAPISELFVEFGPAVAAASIAQVHKAVTREKDGSAGRVVAVKVLRPGIEKTFARELETFAFAANRLEQFAPAARRMQPVNMVKTLAKSVETELDLRLEAAAASQMADNVEGEAGIIIPQVDWDRTAKRVLTTEWIDGVPLHDQEALLAAGHNLPQLAQNFAEFFLLTAMRDGFFHADLHPGNVFVRPDGKLVIVDFGIMGRLDRENRRYLAEILYGVVERDYNYVARLHFEAGLVPPDQNMDDFALALRSMGEPIFGRVAQDMPMSKILRRLFEVTEQFNMVAQPELMFLQKTMVVVEGVARSLDPTFNLWEVGRPILQNWVEELIGPEARLREAAESFAALGRSLPELPRMIERLEVAAKGAARTEAAQSLYRTAPGLLQADPSQWQKKPLAGLRVWLVGAAGVGIGILASLALSA